ncbi:MAG: TlpA disulfide reductase family protein [Psychrilyobacter sp.]|uniref:TlpA family protein disulfide reductase n=1 Tax=Psychrilyobacter sp. TaxID=2586924 RepID=UPI003C7390F5
MKKIIFILLLLVSVLSFGTKEGLEKGNKFPIMNLYNTKGGLEGTSEKYFDKITVYNFGASWCPPCKVEKPLLNKFYNKNKDKVNVVSIMIDDNGSAVDKFFIDNPMDFPHYFDKGQTLSRKFLIRVVPTTYLVDENGIILERIHGAQDWSQLKVEDLEALKN